ncbi:MAG: hypothetical protein JWR07_1913 [Nevskia sp.]|nr:hypothetical protein [Nevskia sp.]
MSVKPKLPAGKSAAYTGQMRGNAQRDKFGDPLGAVPPGIKGMNSTHNDIGEQSGFDGDTSSYIVKKGTPYGEAAKFNFLPPGMDISNQENVDIRGMELKTITEFGYPGDGWEPKPRDVEE